MPELTPDTEKHLVFRIEKYLNDQKGNITHSCFELVDAYVLKSMAEEFASKYSKDSGLKTIVIKANVFNP
jgi:hypothetical protein